MPLAAAFNKASIIPLYKDVYVRLKAYMREGEEAPWSVLMALIWTEAVAGGRGKTGEGACVGLGSGSAEI